MAVTLSIVGEYNGAAFAKARRDLDALEKAALSANGSMTTMWPKQAASVTAFGQKISGVGASISSVGSTLTRGLSLPLAAVGYASIKTAADFQVAMAQTQVATQASAAEMEKLRALAIKLGQDTVFSATDAGNAMLNLAKGGLTQAEIQGGALEQTLNLAAASGVDLADAASTVTASMNTFGLKADQTAVAVNALAGASASSNAEMPDLMIALRQVGQSASMSGLSIQETTGILAAFADKGVIGSDAGTSFKVMLQRLTPMSKEAGIVMRGLGMEFYDAQGNMKSASEIAGIMQRSMSGLTEEQRKAAMQTIFGTDAIRAANVMYELGAKGVDGYVKSSSDMTVAAKFTEARMSGLYGVMEQLKGSIDTALIQNGEALAPTFTALSEGVRSLVDAYSSLSPQAQEAIAKFMVFGIALGPVVKGVGIFTQAIGMATSGIGTLIGATGKGITMLQAFGAGFAQPASGASAFASKAQKAGAVVATVIGKMAHVVKTAMLTIGRALMANPWMLAAAAAAVAVALIIKNWDKVKAFLLAAWNAIKSAASTVWNAIVGIVKKAGELIWSAIQTYFDFYKKMAEFGLRLVQGLWNGINNAVDWVIEKIKGFGLSILDGIKSIFGIASPSKVTEVYGRNLGEGLAGGLINSIPTVNSAVDKVGNAVKTKIANIAAGGAKLDTLVAKLTGAGDTTTQKALSDDILRAMGLRPNGDTTTTTQVVNGYVELMKKVKDEVAKQAARTKLASLGASQSLIEMVLGSGEQWKQAYDRIVAGGKKAVTALMSTFRKTADGITEVRDRIAAATEKAKQVAEEAAAARKQLVQDQIDTLQAQIDRTADMIFDALDAAADGAQRIVDAAQASVDEMLAAYENANDGLKSLTDQAADYASQIGESLRGAFSLKDALSRVATTNARAMQSFLQDLKERVSGDNGVTATVTTNLLDNLRKQAEDVKRFTNQLRSLRSMGLNDASMQEIISAGVEQGTQIAAAILAGGSGAISEINQLESMLSADVQEFGNLLAQDKFGTEIGKAQAALNLASQNLAKANESLDAATRSRDMLVSQIDAMRERTKQILGISSDALETLVDNLQKGIGGTADVIGKILGEVEKKISSLTSMLSSLQGLGSGASSKASTAESLASKAATIDKMIADLDAKTSAAKIRATEIAIQTGAVQVNIDGAGALTKDDVTEIMNNSMLSLSRKIAML